MNAPITIHKSAFGLFAVYTIGLLVTILLTWATAVSAVHNGLQDVQTAVYGVATVLVVLVTTISAYVYGLSKVVLTEDELQVTSWGGLASSNVSRTEFRNIMDVDVKKLGIFSQIFDFGTLLVSTASGERNLELSLIPHVEHLRDLIAQRADAAKTPVQLETQS